MTHLVTNAVTTQLETELDKERKLTAGLGVILTDGGAGGNMTVGVDTAMVDALGFPEDHGITLSFNDGTRELTLTPAGGSVVYYYDGYKKTLSGAQTKEISTAAGMHYIYYANTSGTLTDSSPSAWSIKSAVQVATVYWNGTAGLLGNELHGLQMDRKTHEYLHETVGTRYATGLVGVFSATTHSISAGEWYDEDIEHVTTASSTQVQVLYKLGTTWVWTAAQDKIFHEVSNVLQYNPSGALQDVTNNRYVAYYIYATNHLDYPFVSIMGQATATTLALARTNLIAENLSLGTLPLAEMKLLYRVIIQRSGTSEVIADTTDYRNVTPLPTSSYVATDHGSLSGLQDTDHSAAAIYTSTAGFSGNLSATDTTVQAALDTIDNLVIGSGSVATDTIWDAKGDLAVGTGANTAARLAVGADGYVLAASSGTATGLVWVAPGAGSVAGDTIWDAKGDLAVGTAANAARRLAVGADDTVLTASSGSANGIIWKAPTAYAPTSVSYVTLATNATLTAERVLTAGAGISLTDAGAGGTLTVATSVDGWTAAGSMTYASATTITVASGAAAIYSVGDKLKLTQTTVKYFYIVGVADTLLTVTGGSDYTVANATISSPYYSHQSSPIGFPQWFNYTPTGVAASNVTLTGRFTINGRTCRAVAQCVFSGAITFTTNPTLPVAASANHFRGTLSQLAGIGAGGYIDQGTAWGTQGLSVSVSPSGTTFDVYRASDAATLAANSPITWANTDQFLISAIYEI